MKVIDKRYQLQGLIRKHSFGALWLANDRELSRPFLIRTVDGKQFGSRSEVQKLAQICFTLTRLRHPNVEQINAVRKDSRGNAYIIYPLEKSISLRQLIFAMSNMLVPPEIKSFILGEVARGLAAVHDAREHLSNKPLELYHLGLTPENIQLTQSGGIRIIDFGLAHTERERQVAEAKYLAPEQIEDSGVGAGSDLYSLGVIAYEFFTGRPLRHETGLSELMASILKSDPDITALRQQAPEKVCALIEGCLQRRKSKRPPGATEVADKINALLQGKLPAPAKKIGDYVEKLFETPKLLAAEDTRAEEIRTEEFSPSGAESAVAKMTDSSGKDKKRPRPGEETVIRSVPVGERLKRMQPGDRGGRKLLVILAIVAGILAVGFVAVMVIKYFTTPGETPVTKMETGQIITIPEGAEVYLADSLLGQTPGTFTLEPGADITIRHDCCAELSLPADFDRFEAGPIYLEAIIEVASLPEGARIVLDGEDSGEITPFTLRIRPDDTLNLRLELSGRPAVDLGSVPIASLAEFQSDRFDISLLPEGGYRLVGTFGDKPKPIPQVLLTSAPSGAAVKLGSTGQIIGETPLRYRFGSGGVNLTFTKDGYEDRVVNLPTSSSRKSKYHFLLFRRVYITAYEEGDIDNTVNCKIKNLVYGGSSHSIDEMTPAYVRLPGVECNITLAADAYHDTDTLIAPAQKELTAVMRRKGAAQQQAQVDTQAKPPQEDTHAGKAEIRLFVTDNKDVPVEGAALTAEDRDNDDEELELGLTDGDGKLVVYLKPSRYKFIAKHIDYKLGDENKTVKADNTYVLTIEIKRR